MRWTVLALMATAIGLLGSDSACFNPVGDSTGDVGIIEDPDSRCVVLASRNPPALAFEPSGPLWVVDPSPEQLVPFAVDEVPPVLAEDVAVYRIPADSDSDGVDESNPSPMLDILSFLQLPAVLQVPSLASVTATDYDEVFLFDASLPALGSFDVEVAELDFEPHDYPRLPAPGDRPRTRTAVSTYACVDPPPDKPDSYGDAAPGVGDCPGFYASRTSGAVLSGPGPAPTHLFASMANPGALGQGTTNPQYMPGAVLVYSVVIAETGAITVSPEPDPSAIFTSGFNPTDLTSYTSAGGRNFVLVTVSGVVAPVLDDPDTPVEEGGYIALDGAFIDVIDADTRELVGTIPLGEAGLAGRLAIHQDGRLAVVGSMLGRWVLAVDLDLLDALPENQPAEGPDVLNAAVIRDASNPLEIPHRADGAALTACPGFTAGLAFNEAGTSLYVTDYCDGTLAVIPVAAGAPPILASPGMIDISAPIDTPDATAPRGPGAIAVRPEPVGSYDGPDVFVLVAEPEGLLCAVSVESGS